MNGDTIVACATPGSYGALSVVRVSGPQTLTVIARIFEPRRRQLSDRRLYFGKLVDPTSRQVLDEGFVVLMRGPRSYTAEDVAEFFIHGGHVNQQRILAAICDCGARLAKQGEFTQRAYLNGRIDLTQAEAVIDLINAKTPASLDLALQQLEGRLSTQLQAMRQQLIDARSLLELNIDFIEEDVPVIDYSEIDQRLAAVADDLEALLCSYARGRLYRDGLKVVIAGRPNVGKSSLFNRLLREHRAIVTAIPGTTRDVIEDTVNLDGVPVRFSDTAGIRDATDEVEQIGVARSRAELDSADLRLLVFDRSAPWTAEDDAVLAAGQSAPHLIVLNKCDTPAAWDSERLGRALPISALHGDGLDALISAILASTNALDRTESDTVVLTNTRHRELLLAAKNGIIAARAAVQRGDEPELVAIEVQDALTAIGEVVGIATPDDWLNNIFSQFCIGK